MILAVGVRAAAGAAAGWHWRYGRGPGVSTMTSDSSHPWTPSPLADYHGSTTAARLPGLDHRDSTTGGLDELDHRKQMRTLSSASRRSPHRGASRVGAAVPHGGCRKVSTRVMKKSTKLIMTGAASLLGVALAAGGAYATSGSLSVSDAPGQDLKISGIGPASAARQPERPGARQRERQGHVRHPRTSRTIRGHRRDTDAEPRPSTDTSTD